MWGAISRIILKNRALFLIALFLITAFFGWRATRIEQSYSYARTLPTNDQAYIDYEKLKELYGEDGSVMVLGFSDPDFYKLKEFNGWYDLGKQIKSIEGIQDVLSAATLYNMKRNDSLSRFDIIPILQRRPKSQLEVDSIRQTIQSLPFYEGLIFNTDSNATLMAITFDKLHLNSKKRIEAVTEIQRLGNEFAKANNLIIHYSGMPYIRTAFMQKVSSEMTLFLILAVVVTFIILFLFFRSFIAVSFSIFVCLIGVVISMGTLELFSFKLTLLSALIPPLILVIGIPNCIFIINKYQEELVRHGDKLKALALAVEKVAMSNFLANITTAIGFGVFYFTNSAMLMEFGIVASINVVAVFIIAHVLLPIIYSFLPPPAPKYTKHLQNKNITRLMEVVDKLVHSHRSAIYIVVTVVTLISLYGMTKINVNGYLVDDLPAKDPICEHLHFFERNFRGVMPFEVNVDTKKANGVFADRGGSAAPTLYKIQSLQRMMGKFGAFSKPVSLVEALKFAYQAFKDGDPKKYKVLPGATELAKLRDYTGTIKGKENKLASFMDSSKRYTRVSYQMADVGTDSMQKIINVISPKVDSIFNFDREKNTWVADSLKYNVVLTGLSHVFLKSNAYLFHHLFVSLLIAIGLILIIGIALFRSIPIVVLSKLPCLIPLAITAGIMGFAGIPFKPSTILIFSIAFGIASDGTIYILTEYRHQLRKLHLDRSQAISRTVRELGTSMIYTNTILFFGFAIFAASSFGGTVAMGILISITLLVSLITNLLLLPSILLSLEKRIATKDILEKPFIEVEAEEED
jgi:uncharacterized protein